MSLKVVVTCGSCAERIAEIDPILEKSGGKFDTGCPRCGASRRHELEREYSTEKADKED